MDKAIYGLAQPFGNSYWEYNKLTNTFTFDKTNKESVQLDSVVGATIYHDYGQVLGRTDEGTLFIHVNDQGVYFKVIPTTPLALSAYKKVKKGIIKYCSISAQVESKKRDYEEEERITSLLHFLKANEKVVINKFKKILVYEVCICNYPKNEETFCTTDPDDPRLKGVIWDEKIV